MRSKIKAVILFVAVCATCSAQLSLYSDEFGDNRSLENWKNLNITEGWDITQLEWYSINDSLAGHLQMVPYTSAWYAEYRGSYLYKEITGDFIVTAEVSVQGRNSTTRPTSRYSLGGLLVRSPTAITDGQDHWVAQQQNYIFLSAGYGDGNCSGSCQAQLEVKTTVNSNSNLQLTNIQTQTVQLRMVRLSNIVLVMYRELPSGTWQVHRRYRRNDFPETIQVGFTAYTDWDKVSSTSAEYHNNHTLTHPLPDDPAHGVSFQPDIIADFDYFRIDHAAVPDSLSGANFQNASQVSDDLIRELYGADTDPCVDFIRVDSLPVDHTFVSIQADSVEIAASVTYDAAIRCQALQIQEEMSVDTGTELEIDISTCQEE